MIKSKEDYAFYFGPDRLALTIKHKRPRIFQDEIWKFERLLRKVEYLENCGNNRLDAIIRLQAKYSLQKLSTQFGFAIPRNVFGPGCNCAWRSHNSAFKSLGR